MSKKVRFENIPPLAEESVDNLIAELNKPARDRWGFCPFLRTEGDCRDLCGQLFPSIKDQLDYTCPHRCNTPLISERHITKMAIRLLEYQDRIEWEE